MDVGTEKEGDADGSDELGHFDGSDTMGEVEGEVEGSVGVGNADGF